MQKLIKEIAARLTWEIKHEPGERDLEIVSEPWEKTHTIRFPSSGSDWRDIEYLHELAHATLAEKHYLLSTAFFKTGTPPEKYLPLTNPVRVASDWYADDLLMQWAPKAEAAEIREHADYALAATGHGSDMLYGGGLCIAQAVHYLRQKIHTVPRQYRGIVNILLSFDPGKPSVPAKEKLINHLAALTIQSRVRLSTDDGMDVWEILN